MLLRNIDPKYDLCNETYIILLWFVYEYVGCENPIREQRWKNNNFVHN